MNKVPVVLSLRKILQRLLISYNMQILKCGTTSQPSTGVLHIHIQPYVLCACIFKILDRNEFLS